MPVRWQHKLSPEKVQEKILWMTNVIYETKLNMLRDYLLKEEQTCILICILTYGKKYIIISLF